MNIDNTNISENKHLKDAIFSLSMIADEHLKKHVSLVDIVLS